MRDAVGSSRRCRRRARHCGRSRTGASAACPSPSCAASSPGIAAKARARRCVCLIDDAAARAHGDPRHPDGLTFALHDLCHLEKFVTPEHHAGQVGFFRLVERALDAPAMIALDAELDDGWRADRDYVIADMNGSAVFLFAALKMKLKLAVGRRQAPFDPALEILLGAMDFRDDVRDAARAVSPRRDHPAAAYRLLDHFETVARDAGESP